MQRGETGEEGVVVYRGVPVVTSAEQHGQGYLHIKGSPRDVPSYYVRAFFGNPAVTVDSGRDHPAFAGETTIYNSPPPSGVPVAASAGRPLAEEPGSYDVVVDVSDSMHLIGDAEHVDVALVLTDMKRRPLDTSRFFFENLSITRNP
jgi:hypothetical protein